MIKVAVLSCYRLLSASLSKLIDSAEDMEVVSVVDNWQSAYRLVEEETIDVLLMEVSMPKVDHFAVIRHIIAKAPNTKILILYSQSTEILPAQFLEAGVDGFLCRKADVDEVIFAINELSRGKQYLSKNYLLQLGQQQISGEQTSPFSSLSKRELQILLLITSGSKVAAICEKLHLSPKTVNTYRYRIFNKLGIDSDVSLARWAIRQGLMEA